jgi:transcriptional regulator with XRE-family HTH domain
MARKVKSAAKKTGLHYAREARGMSRTELVKRTGVSKQQLSRLENGLIRLRLDHLKPFANVLGYSPEQILLWGRFAGTGDQAQDEGLSERVPELASGSASGLSGLVRRKEGRHTDRIKSEGWVFPASFVTKELQASPKQLLVVAAEGDSMAPTIMSGDRVIVDTAHKTPSPDGLYAIRDPSSAIAEPRVNAFRMSMARAFSPAPITPTILRRAARFISVLVLMSGVL